MWKFRIQSWIAMNSCAFVMLRAEAIQVHAGMELDITGSSNLQVQCFQRNHLDIITVAPEVLAGSMEPIKGLNKVIFLLLSLLGYYMHHIKINKLLHDLNKVFTYVYFT